MKFTIRKPIWGGYSGRKVGLAQDKLEATNTIEITATDKDGNRLYPNTYTITKEKALTYPSQRLPQGVLLRVIPISELEIIPDTFIAEKHIIEEPPLSHEEAVVKLKAIKDIIGK
jgi:hypothetical protein